MKMCMNLQSFEEFYYSCRTIDPPVEERHVELFYAYVKAHSTAVNGETEPVMALAEFIQYYTKLAKESRETLCMWLHWIKESNFRLFDCFHLLLLNLLVQMV